MDRVKARAASMPNPLDFLQRPVMQNPSQIQAQARAWTQAQTRSMTAFSQRIKDPNCAEERLLYDQKCVYERSLPGNSYITAHITRLQKGYYDSPVVHGDRMDNCRFVAISFVFHPVNTTHRFVSARISLSLQDRALEPQGGWALPPQIDHPNNARPSLSKESTRLKPRFLRHAPHLLYGVLSPETLDWTFNLAGSLGVSQGPANASISPSGGVKSSYKVYKMMKIQGSVRTLNSWHGHEFDVEDGSLVWTLEENELQKSGLPREFTFVMLLTKGDAPDVQFDIDIEPVVGSWYGTYPKWWLDRIWYRPLHKEAIDIDMERGQRFGPSTKKEGFNFASLMGKFDDFVTLPGTTYSSSDQGASLSPVDPSKPAGGQSNTGRQLTASPTPDTNKDLNIRVFLEGFPKESLGNPSNPSQHPLAKSQSSHPTSGLVISRSRSRTRSRPRSEYYSTPPSLESSPRSRPRPVSAIYEGSHGMSRSESPDLDDFDRRHRPLSATTDISEDLFLTPLSPVPGLQVSKPLRHSRSRPDLQGDFGASSGHKPQQSNKSQGGVVRPGSDMGMSSEPVVSSSRRSEREERSQQDREQQTDSKTPLRYPRRPGAQPMRRAGNSQPARPSQLSGSAVNPAVLRIQNQNINTNNSPHKRLTPRQARNSAYVNPVDINHARFKLAEDSPTLPPPPQPPSFPPTSFPQFAPPVPGPVNTDPSQVSNSTASSSREPPQMDKSLPPAPMPPPAPMAPGLYGLGVDTLVQQEVSNYLKAHPEVYSPQSSVQGTPDNFTRRQRPGSLDGGSTSRPTEVNSNPQHNLSLSQMPLNFSIPQSGRPLPTITSTGLNIEAGSSRGGGPSGAGRGGANPSINISRGGGGGGSSRHGRSQSAGAENSGDRAAAARTNGLFGIRLPSNTSNTGYTQAGSGTINLLNSHNSNPNPNQNSQAQAQARLQPQGQEVNTQREHSRERVRPRNPNNLDHKPDNTNNNKNDSNLVEDDAYARKIKDAASNGEFIRVSLGGLGHGGWEYLE